MHRELSPVQRFARQQHVLEDGEVRKELRDLKRSGDPSRRPLMRRQTGDVRPVQGDVSRRRPKLAADDIEQRRLARAVRPDERMALARLKRQVHVVDGFEAAEMSGDALEHEAGGRAFHYRCEYRGCLR